MKDPKSKLLSFCPQTFHFKQSTMAPRTLCRYSEQPHMVAASTKNIHRRRWLRVHNALQITDDLTNNNISNLSKALTPENFVDNSLFDTTQTDITADHTIKTSEIYEPENSPELVAIDHCTTDIFEPIESNDLLEDSPESTEIDDNFTNTSESTVAYDSSEYSSESDEDLQDLPELSDRDEDVFNSNPDN